MSGIFRRNREFSRCYGLRNKNWDKLRNGSSRTNPDFFVHLRKKGLVQIELT